MPDFDSRKSFRPLLPASSLLKFALVGLLPLGLTIGCGGDAEQVSDPETEAPPAVELVDLGEALPAAVASIDEEGLEARIAVLADDDMEGRGPGSAGDEKAQAYLIEQMKSIGLEPGAADGGWKQSFDIVGVDSKVPGTWTFEGKGGKLSLKAHDQFIAFSGVQDKKAVIDNAEVVFVGYGIEAPEYDWNDWDGVDVAGKVVLMLNNDPDWDADLFEGNRRLWYGRWDYKYQMAAERGAVGAIIHHTRPSAGYPFSVVQSSWTGPQFQLPAAGEPRIQVGAWTTEDATRKLVALAGQDWDALEEKARSADFTPVPLGLTTSLEVSNAIEKTGTSNILGRLPGSDPAVSAETVIYGAHFDHLGVGEPDDSGDAIYNGAMDNASGVAQVLEIAEAFKTLPRAPRRSVLFAMWAAEEQGLLGSKFFAANPPLHPGLMAANVNLDGGNIFGATEDVAFIGLGKSSLDDVVVKHAGDQNREVVGDQFPDRGFFYRSDQFSLAKIGVPAVYLDGGTKFRGKDADWGKQQMEAWEGTKYHQQGDELDDTWVFDGMVEDAQLSFLVGLDVAEADEMPTWNAGDEFEAARKKAVAERPDK